MVESILRPIAEHPKKPWIVTILTVGFVLVFTWPVVDSYLAASRRRATARKESAEATAIGDRLNQFKSMLEKRRKELAQARSAAVGEKNIEAVRDQVVDVVKAQGLRLRRVRLGDASTRTWYETDNPLSNQPRAENEKKSPFKLRSQTLSLQVAGPLNNHVALLNELGAMPFTMHASGFQLRRAAEDPAQNEMELDLAFFDLVANEPKRP